MESRNAYGCSIDLPAEGKLPTVDQLVGIVEGSSEYAVAWRHERMLALRLVPAGLPVARHAALKPHLTTVVSGGTKVGGSREPFAARAKQFVGSCIRNRQSVSPHCHVDFNRMVQGPFWVLMRQIMGRRIGAASPPHNVVT